MTEPTLAPLVVVFDTNVLIPLIIPASKSARLFLRLQAAGHTVATSPHILDEVRDKMLTKASLRTWLGLTDEEIQEFLDQLPTLCDVVPGHRQCHGAVPTDPKDDKIVAAALEAGASHIVSEDKHLLTVKQYQAITIMSRDDFERELDRLGVP